MISRVFLPSATKLTQNVDRDCLHRLNNNVNQSMILGKTQTSSTDYLEFEKKKI